MCFVALLAATTPRSAKAIPGWGAWATFDNPLARLIPKMKSKPSLLVTKAGIFSKQGSLRIVVPFDQLQPLCERNEVEMHAWVTHALGKQAGLTRAVGQRLGAELNGLVEKGCFRSIELDMEPMATPTPWLAAFLQEVRRILRADRKLFVAVPAISPPATYGYHWAHDSLDLVLAEADGIDVMGYDTGFTNADQYGKSLAAAVRFAAKYADKKEVRIGLPAYYDTNKPKHRLDVENVRVALNELRKIPDVAKTLCHRNVRLLYYAFWTMKTEDVQAAGEFDQWLSDRCLSEGKK